MPLTLSVITSAFPPEERSRAVGVWTAVAGGAGILGMFLSAVLVDFLSWRWLFVLPVALTAASGLMAVRRIADSRQVSRHGYDVLGSLLSALAVIGVICFLHEGPQHGGSSAGSIAGLLIGTGAGLAFVVWDRHHESPVLDMRAFRKRGRTSGAVSLLAWFGVQVGVFVVLYPYFQAVLGWSGLLSTVALMPMALLMMVFSAVAPRLAARTGPKLTIAAGVLVGGVGLALMATHVSVTGGTSRCCRGWWQWAWEWAWPWHQPPKRSHRHCSVNNSGWRPLSTT